MIDFKYIIDEKSLFIGFIVIGLRLFINLTIMLYEREESTTLDRKYV